MDNDIERIKSEILAALRHEEAEDGLYFNNIVVVHEEEERPIVTGTDQDIRTALKELIEQGIVATEMSGSEVIYRIAQ